MGFPLTKTIPLHLAIVLAFVPFFFAAAVFAAASGADLLKAKKDAEAKGYIFETSHDDIVAKAKKEGKLRVITTLEADVVKVAREAFRRKYPFISDFRSEELIDVDANQRFLLEIKAGRGKGWDTNRLYTEFYEEYFPHQKKFDILRMAEHKVLTIPPRLLDPKTPNVVTISSNMSVIAYNNKLLPADKAPDHWEDFLKPEFKGRKFVVDIRPISLAVTVPAWGLEKTVDFARRLAAQDPIWGRGHTKILGSLAIGENPLFLGPNLGAAIRAQKKDPTGVLGVKIVEPVPTRLHEANGVLNQAESPYAGLLWLEFLASPEGQKIMDDYWPLGASVFSPGSQQEQLTKGKKLSVVDWNHYAKVDDYLNKIVEALGFPKAK